MMVSGRAPIWIRTGTVFEFEIPFRLQCCTELLIGFFGFLPSVTVDALKDDWELIPVTSQFFNVLIGQFRPVAFDLFFKVVHGIPPGTTLSVTGQGASDMPVEIWNKTRHLMQWYPICRNRDMNQQSSEVFNVKEIRKNAANSVESGAVTESYPLDLKKTHQLLNQALASEILCVLRYRHHQIIAKGIDYPQVAAEFEEHAESEERHMLMLAERIDQLGGDPDFDPATIVSRSATEYGSPSDTPLTALIKEDLVAERIVIDVYRKMIEYFGKGDPTSRRLMETILADEEEHAAELADLLAKVE